MLIHHGKLQNETTGVAVRHIAKLLRYPDDLLSFLTLSRVMFDPTWVAYRESDEIYAPITSAHNALVHWNHYLATNGEEHYRIFLKRAYWLIEHESRIGDDAGGWPGLFLHPDVHTAGPHLSAIVQASNLSIMLRAYQLTGEAVFFAAASRVVRTFERDILDGGVSSPIGTDGVFFEEVAIYPAAHQLSSCIFALLGLYDYKNITGDEQIEKLIGHALATLHYRLDAFDAGFWTYHDLLHRHLASPAHMTLQIMLLEALAHQSGSERCTILAKRWRGYQAHSGSRLCYLITSRGVAYGDTLWSRMQTRLLPRRRPSSYQRVCIPLNAFPVTGGIRTVLAGIAQATSDVWQVEYLTRHMGPNTDGLVIHQFGTANMSPWQFPTVWLYALAGLQKLVALMRHGAAYTVILPQDGVFTGVFAALAAKIAGVRSVCIDHGTLTLLKSKAYRNERIDALATKSYPQRILRRLLYIWYWPSLSLLARLAVRNMDHLLIPGIVGDGVEEHCERLGAHPDQITRFASMIDIERHPLLDTLARENIRKEKGIAADAIVVAMPCRLAPEKGIQIALEAISRTLVQLSPALRARVRIVIAGDGPLREAIKKELYTRELLETCLLWGEIPAADVLSLLSFSDIFLYTSLRGACFSMAVLEAMASGCALIASTQPMANAHLLSEGRGIAVEPGNVEQTSEALFRLVNNLELCRQMGKLAREYIAVQHSATMFRRTLMRVTYWSGLGKLLNTEDQEVSDGAITGS